MELTYPLGLWGLLMTVPIIFWHLAKPRPRRVSVSTLMFWDQVVAGRSMDVARSGGVDWISLCLQLLVIGGLVGALCRPRFVSSAGATTVIVIDNSLSMTAGAPARSPLQQAKRRAKQLVRSTSGEIQVLTASRVAPVAMGLTRDRSAVTRAIDSIEAEADTRLSASVGLATSWHERTEPSWTVVLTDATAGGIGQLAGLTDVDVEAFSLPETDNVAITRFVARRDMVDALEFEVLVELVNYGARMTESILEMSLGDQLIDRFATRLAAGQTWREVRRYATSEGGELVCRIDTEDALAADNVARTDVIRHKTLPVSLIGPRSYFLEEVFRAVPHIKLDVAPEPPTSYPANALLVFHQTVPREVIDGPTLIVNPTADFTGVRVGDELVDTMVARQVTSGPLMAHLDLEGFEMWGARALAIDRAHKPLAMTRAGEPIYFQLSEEGGRTIVLNADLDRADLPLRTAFPILISNVVATCRGVDTEPLVTGPLAGLSESALQPVSGLPATNRAVPTRPATWPNLPIWQWFGALAFAALLVEALYHSRGLTWS